MVMGDAQIVQVKPGDPLHSQLLNLRHEVLRVPIGRSLFTEDLSQEADQIFLAALASTGPKGQIQSESSSNKVIGCIMLALYTGDPSCITNKLRQMAVSPDYEGKGIGSMLVQRAEAFSREDGKKRIYLHGRKNAMGFYLKMGYTIISDEFLESGIPHFAMEKIL